MNPNTPPPTDGPVFLGSYWDQPLVAIEPTLVDIELSNDRLLFAGKSHVLFAPSAAGKTFVAVQMALSVIQQTTRTVLFLDYESSLDVLLSRFRQLGGTRQEADRFAYWRIEDPIPNKSEIESRRVV